MFETVKSWMPGMDPAPVVAVVRLTGVIASGGRFEQGLNLAGVARPLEQAFTCKPAKAVALIINSPGGSPVQSALIHDRIRALAVEHEKTVFAFVEDVGASGGYWLACAGDEIYADASSIVGSIGVISAGFGFPGLLERFGVERRVYAAGENKSTLDPFLPEDPKDIERLKAIQESVHEAFKTHVRTRRGAKIAGADETELFSGAFWAGEEAKKLGLIDGIGDLRSVMRSRYGDEVKLKVFTKQSGSMLRRLLSGQSQGYGGAGLFSARDLIETAETQAYWARYGL